MIRKREGERDRKTDIETKREREENRKRQIVFLIMFLPSLLPLCAVCDFILCEYLSIAGRGTSGGISVSSYQLLYCFAQSHH